jgi:hypothetical protein
VEKKRVARAVARSWTLEPSRRVCSGLRLRSGTAVGRWPVGRNGGRSQQVAHSLLSSTAPGGGATREQRRWLARWLLAGPRKEVLPMGFRVVGSFRAFSSLGRPRCSNFRPNQFLSPTILWRVASMKVASPSGANPAPTQQHPARRRRTETRPSAGTISSVQAKPGRWPTIKTAARTPATHHHQESTTSRASP